MARAILKNAPILILDEPTSSLDAISEEIVFAALRRLRAGRTTIVIAHRLSTVRDADRILVLDGGRIAAQGRHEELLKTSQLYRRMCARLSVGKSLDDPETVDELIQAAGDRRSFVTGARPWSVLVAGRPWSLSSARPTMDAGPRTTADQNQALRTSLRCGSCSPASSPATRSAASPGVR